MKSIGRLGLIWLVVAMAATAQEDNAPVLDTTGQPLQRGVEYYIRLAVTDNGGPFTLIDRNGSCPLYVGQENVTGLNEIPVTFGPFEEGENVVRLIKSFKVAFSAATRCVEPTTWKVGEEEPESQRRLITTGQASGGRFGPLGNYFLIEQSEQGFYTIRWCPADLCPTCRLRCGYVGNLVENGKRLAALDGSALPVEFDRKA